MTVQAFEGSKCTNTEPVSATGFLKKASYIMEERAAEYDSSEGGERSILKTCKVFELITGKHLTEAEGWLFMQLLKDVRQWTAKGFHRDSAEDCISYAALKAEALVKTHEEVQ